MSDASRPILITLIGALYALLGVIIIIAGAMMVAGSNLIDLSSTGITAIAGTSGGIALIIVGLIPFIIGYGLLKGWKIMWYLGVIFGILGLILMIVSLTIIAIIIDAIILYYLFRPGVKAFFGIGN